MRTNRITLKPVGWAHITRKKRKFSSIDDTIDKDDICASTPKAINKDRQEVEEGSSVNINDMAKHRGTERHEDYDD